MHALVIPVSLAAAYMFAVASYLKHRSAEGFAADRDGTGRVTRLARRTITDPLWLFGLIADTAGVALQILALRIGALSVVQPVLVTTVLFTLFLRHRLRQSIPRRDFGWALVVSVALCGFLALAGTFGKQSPATADRTPALVAVVVGVLLAVCCVVIGQRSTDGSRAAALLGIAVGAIYAANAALLKTLTSIASQGLVAIVLSWQLYALLLAGTIGLLLNQLAFQAGPITASLPAVSTVDPLASIAIGVSVYDEPIRHGPLAAVGLTLLLLLLGAAMIQLAREPESGRSESVTTRVDSDNAG